MVMFFVFCKTMPDPIQGHNQVSVEVASAHNRATYLNPDYFCALSVGWICAYISVWCTWKQQLIALWYYGRSVAQILLVSCQTVSPTSPSFVTPQSFHLLGFHALIHPLQLLPSPTLRGSHIDPYVPIIIISILLLLSIRVKSSLEITMHHILLSVYSTWHGPLHAKIWAPAQSQMVDETLLI